ncbi:MAG TPA: TetR family transcriptional regulator [Trebonia sp.]|nr:TetR family transcriptional regulator [Trebonia sp.]
MSAGLREQHKLQTRAAISAVATRLFAERGFGEVTIAQVAEAAGVAKMTVTNYFPRKEDLVFDQADAVIGQLARAAADRAEGESYLTAIRRVYLAELDREDGAAGIASPGFAAMIRDSPALIARGAEIAYARERALGDMIAEAEGTDSPELRLVAAQLAAAHRVLYDEAARLSLAGEPRPRIRAALRLAAERVFALLEPVIGSYGT